MAVLHLDLWDGGSAQRKKTTKKNTKIAEHYLKHPSHASFRHLTYLCIAGFMVSNENINFTQEQKKSPTLST